MNSNISFEISFEELRNRLLVPYYKYLPSVYDQVYELGGKTAIEKFGKDPKPFRETLDKFEEKEFKKIIKECAIRSSSSHLRFDQFIIRDYIGCLIAIIQVDLEYPGFIKQFPEAQEYLMAINRYNQNQVIWKFEKIYNDTIKSFNRYSGNSDLKYVKSLFEFDDKDLKITNSYNDIRFDDYISLNFKKYWKMEDDEIHDYLLTNYVYQETLLPQDYRLIICSCCTEYEMEGYKDLDKNDMEWVDIYFENNDKILGKILKDINKVRPEIMKKVNLTLT